jgi:hypothetical protein
MQDNKYVLGVYSFCIALAIYAFAGLGMLALSRGVGEGKGRSGGTARTQARKGEPKRAAPAATGSGATEGMTKAEFRARVQTFNGQPGAWDGNSGRGGRDGYFGNAPGDVIGHIGFNARAKPVTPPAHHYDVVATLSARDFRDAFGLPAKTQTLGEVAVWSWVCRDGTVEVIHVPNGRPERVNLICIDDR